MAATERGLLPRCYHLSYPRYSCKTACNSNNKPKHESRPWLWIWILMRIYQSQTFFRQFSITLLRKRGSPASSVCSNVVFSSIIWKFSAQQRPSEAAVTHLTDYAQTWWTQSNPLSLDSECSEATRHRLGQGRVVQGRRSDTDRHSKRSQRARNSVISTFCIVPHGLQLLTHLVQRSDFKSSGALSMQFGHSFKLEGVSNYQSCHETCGCSLNVRCPVSN
jgi:hypothetical protein